MKSRKIIRFLLQIKAIVKRKKPQPFGRGLPCFMKKAPQFALKGSRKNGDYLLCRLRQPASSTLGIVGACSASALACSSGPTQVLEQALAVNNKSPTNFR